MQIGFAMCGSFCTHAASLEVLTRLKAQGYDILPIMSEITAFTDTRFGKAADLYKELQTLCGCEPIHTIVDAEPLGPAVPLEALVIAPCTGNTLAKIAGGITDTPVTMAAKAHLRCDRPTVIALASTGVHSNGFSLVRKVFDVEKADLKTPIAELGGKSLGEALLTPTKIYVKPVLALLEKVNVKGISHITGGGFYENIPRSIPDGFGAKIDKASLRILPIFDLIAKTGNIPERDMFNTFNMGVGMSIVVAKEDTAVREALNDVDGTEITDLQEVGDASQLGIDVSKYNGAIDWDKVRNA